MKATQEAIDPRKDNPVYDVIISGAGPVGLFLACELALANCSVLMLEKAEDPQSPLKHLPFGIRGLSAPTIEALCRRGLLDELEIHKRIKDPHMKAPAGAGPKPPRQVGHFAGIPLLESYVDPSQWKYRLPGSTPASLISEMAELETVLTRRAVALGVKIRRGTAVTDFQQTPDGLIIYAGDQTFGGKWLVGCDGARSIVRKRGGFEFAGTEPDFTGYSTKVDLADPEMIKPGRHVTSKGMYLQSQPGYLNIQDFDGGAFHNSDKPVTREHLQEVLRRISGLDITITALHIATTWTDRARQATAYRKGRVLLAGDAAHIHSPLGGQGLNLGIGDAMNLGWKLAATIRQNAPQSLLDSYEAERHPLGIQVLDWSRAQVSIMRPTPEAKAMYAITRDLINSRDGATYMAGRIWGIHMHYEMSGDHSLTGEPDNLHPLTGYSVPNFEFEDGAAIGGFMQDGRGILLDFDRDASLKTLAEEYGNQLRYISGNVKDRLGLKAALIRPDGIIAWATDKAPDLSGLRHAAARWFLPDTGIRH